MITLKTVWLETSSWKQNLICLAIVLVWSFCTYYRHFEEPNYLFWDEGYHVTAAEKYLENIAQLESHPPLGKLLIAAGEYIAGVNASVDKRVLTQTKHIGGDRLPNDFNLAGMRIMPTLFGMLTAFLVYGFFLSLTNEKHVMALLFTGFYLFENAYIVHFRAVHLDSFQMFFTVAALWLFVDSWKLGKPLRWHAYAGMGLLSGIAIMVKVNAVILLALLPALYLNEYRTLSGGIKSKAADFLGKAAAALAALVFVFIAVFALHLSAGRGLPDAATAAGNEDLQNMSATFRHFLEFHEDISPAIMSAAAQDYFAFMRKVHLGVPKLNACNIAEGGSSPVNWPFMTKTINYRWDSNSGVTRYVQLAGNPLGWLLGLFALIASFCLVISHRLFASPLHNTALYRQIEIFTGLYAVYMGLHLYLASLRVMYLYHYFLGLFISYVLFVLVWQYLEDVHGILKRRRYWLLGGLMLAVFASFVFIAPLTYHLPLTKEACELRNIFKPIVECR